MEVDFFFFLQKHQKTNLYAVFKYDFIFLIALIGEIKENNLAIKLMN